MIRIITSFTWLASLFTLYLDRDFIEVVGIIQLYDRNLYYPNLLGNFSFFDKNFYLLILWPDKDFPYLIEDC